MTKKKDLTRAGTGSGMLVVTGAASRIQRAFRLSCRKRISRAYRYSRRLWALPLDVRRIIGLLLEEESRATLRMARLLKQFATRRFARVMRIARCLVNSLVGLHFISVGGSNLSFLLNKEFTNLHAFRRFLTRSQQIELRVIHKSLPLRSLDALIARFNLDPRPLSFARVIVRKQTMYTQPTISSFYE